MARKTVLGSPWNGLTPADDTPARGGTSGVRSWVRTPGTSVLSTIMISRDCRTPRGSLARPPFRPSFRPPARSMPATSPASSPTCVMDPSWCAFVRAAGEAPHTAQPAATATATATNGSEEVQTSCGAGAGTGGGGGPAKKVKVKEENKDVACPVSLSHSLFGAEASVLVVVRIHGGCLAHTMCTVFATQRQQRHESQRMVSELPVRSQRLSLMWLYSPQNLTRKDVFHTTTASLSAPAARWPCAPCPSGGGGAVPCVGYQPLVAGGC